MLDAYICILHDRIPNSCAIEVSDHINMLYRIMEAVVHIPGIHSRYCTGTLEEDNSP